MTDITTLRTTTVQPTLNPEQQAALDSILAWANDPFSPPFFVLKGYAGTGKTFTVKMLPKLFRGRIAFCAPTNKATKVLRQSVRTPDYTPECRTIYSLLGLRMEANGELKELAAPDDPIDLSDYRMVIVDEGSMINATVLKYIKQAAEGKKLKFLFMGDPAQLPPVKELESPIWKFEGKAELATVMRHDNQILTLATAIRKVVDHPAPTIRLASDNDERGGVWKHDKTAFTRKILSEAERGGFSDGSAKVIAWRNVTVDQYNNLIRLAIYGQEAGAQWLPGDRVLFTEPAKDFNDEIVATTDDEGTVEKVHAEYHPIAGEIKCFRVTVQLDGGALVVAYTVHPESQSAYTRRVEELAQAARGNGRKWRDFWAFKENFHGLRHAYAITAHRSQGSTYSRVFVNYQDILLNRNRQEAFRCLYVACTRPTTELHLA